MLTSELQNPTVYSFKNSVKCEERTKHKIITNKMVSFCSFIVNILHKFHIFINIDDGILASAFDTVCQVKFHLCVAAWCIWPCSVSVSFCSALITGVCVRLIVLTA